MAKLTPGQRPKSRGTVSRIGIESYNAGIDVSLEPLKRVELRELPGPRARTAVLDSEVVARCRSPLAAFEFSSQSTTSSTMPICHL